MKHVKIKTLIVILIISGLSASAKFNFEINNSGNLIERVQILSIDDTNGIIAGMNYVPMATLENKSSDDQAFIVTMRISNGYESRKQITLSKNIGVSIMFDNAELTKGEYIFSVTIYSQNDEAAALSKLSIPVTIATDSLTYK